MITRTQVRAEAMRMARKIVKAELKRQKIKISYVESSDITKAARYILANEPSITRTAKRRLQRRAKP